MSVDIEPVRARPLTVNVKGMLELPGGGSDLGLTRWLQSLHRAGIMGDRRVVISSARRTGETVRAAKLY
jgi:hypothetical protein